MSAVEGSRFIPGQKCLTTGDLPNTLNKEGATMCLWPSLEESDSVFTVTWLGNGFYKIKLKNSYDMCLDVPGGRLDHGTIVQQWQDNDTASQQWQINETGDGNGYTIQARCNGWYLDVEGGSTADGTAIQLWEGNDSNAQRWYFIPWGGGSAAKQQIPDGEYQIVSQNYSDLAINVEDKVMTGLRSDDSRHTFQVKWLGDGDYEIINTSTGGSLDVPGAQSRQGTGIGVHPSNHQYNQKWLLRYSENGSFNIISKCNGLYLDFEGGGSLAGKQIMLWQGHGTLGQQWRFIPWGESIGQTIPDGEYQIVSHAGSGRVLGVDESHTEAGNGINVELNSWLDDERYTFDVKYLGNGYYSIVNRSSNLALGAADAWNDGGIAQLGEANSEDVQKWMIKDCGDGSYGIISKSSGLYLSADEFDPQDATGVSMSSWFWQTTCKDLQKWKFVLYDRTVSVESVTLDRDSLTLHPGEQVTLQAQVSPEDAADKTLIWESGDESVASVDSDGKVTAKAAGSAEITVRTSNGKTAFCFVTVHEHSYDTEWKTDEQNHWKECGCGEKSEERTHTFAWKIDKEATQEAEGVKHEECAVCGFTRNENTAIDKLSPDHEHSFGTVWKSDGENHWKECECGEKSEIAPHGFAWKTDEGNHWKECVCGKKIEESAHAFEWIIDREATQEAEGVKHEECSACGLKRSEGTVIDKLPADHEHSYGSGWASDVQNHWKECECGEKMEESPHSYAWIIDREPTQEEEGSQHEECSVCGLKRNEGTVIEKFPTGHDHSYGTEWKFDEQNHWKECECGEKSDESAHAFDWIIDRNPTQEAEGLKHEECSVCGTKRNEGTKIEKLPTETPEPSSTAEPTETPEPSSTPEPTAPPNPDSNGRPDREEPFIKGEHGKMGWDVILNVLKETEGESLITIDMNGASIVPGNVLDEIRAKGITVAFELGGGITWSVDGKGITADRADAIDFSVTVGTAGIPADIVGTVANGRASIQISLSHNGEFGCTPVLSINLGKENAGLAARLYYYNQVSGRLDFVSSAGIGEDGTANLPFRYASEYVIVIGDEDGTGSISPTRTPAETGNTNDSDKETAAVVSPETGDETRVPWLSMAVGAIAVILAAGILTMKQRKK